MLEHSGTDGVRSDCVERHGNRDDGALDQRAAGSIDYSRSKFQSFGINRLELVSLTFASWNQFVDWLRRLDTLRQAA